jgi:hypothetical protein
MIWTVCEGVVFAGEVAMEDSIVVLAADEVSALATAHAYDRGEAEWGNHWRGGRTVAAVSIA